MAITVVEHFDCQTDGIPQMGTLACHGDIGLLQQGLPGVEIGGKRRLEKGGIPKQDEPESISFTRCSKLFKRDLPGSGEKSVSAMEPERSSTIITSRPNRSRT